MEEKLKNFMHEAVIMRYFGMIEVIFLKFYSNLRHENIVRFYGITRSPLRMVRIDC